MNRDDIVKMARESGISKPWDQEPVKWETLERFASLVEAAVEERMKWDGLHSCHPECDRPACVHTRKAVEAEREACAKVCEAHRDDWLRGVGRYEFMAEGADYCADAIRARVSNV